MTQPTDQFWRLKLAAWIHDPAEKALVLMRDPGTSHEQGTLRLLREQLFHPPLTEEEITLVREADHWAAAADRPQFPKSITKRVIFASHPELVHPLTGKISPLLPLKEISAASIKEVSFDHFGNDLKIDPPNARRTYLAYWRFGPQTPASDLGALWGLLPADTRVPDHTIWSHLDFTSALAGAMASGDSPALLVVSLGPVQDFIAQARKAEDLWAGSHLLSTLAWEAMKVIAQYLGPDAILFPKLRGLPLVDLWLQDEIGLPKAWFDNEPWRKSTADANPLFAASLPNKFFAVVPEGQAVDLAQAIENRLRSWALERCQSAAEELAVESGRPETAFANDCATQLQAFPEVHWAIIPWSLAAKSPHTTDLESAAAPFTGPTGLPLLTSTGWRLLNHDLHVAGEAFYTPNPGTLYPALYDLAERALAAAKSLRAFAPLSQSGLRCKLCGERDALGDDRMWADIAACQRSWSKPNECLCALCWWKRSWGRQLAKKHELRRFPVSTHTMALATSFGRLLDRRDQLNPKELANLRQQLNDCERVSLPRSLANVEGDLGEIFHRLPDALDRADESDAADRRASRLRRDFTALAGAAPENYYALIQMDGDFMGKWLTGGIDDPVTFGEVWHSHIRNCVDGLVANNPELKAYRDEPRPPSPAQHAAIAEALQAFSRVLAPFVVDHLKGRLLYAGGDDLLAMVSLDDLLPCLASLESLYRGQPLPAWAASWPDLKCANGFALQKKDLYRLMGGRATCSAGAVIAHFSNPLSRVLRELRAAEHDAKHSGTQKNAVSLRLLKRSGGATHLTLPWYGLESLHQLRRILARPDVSRRAAYNLQSQLPLLPATDLAAMLPSLFAYQFPRQGADRDDGLAVAAAALKLEADLSARGHTPGLAALVHQFLTVGEFLAREGRLSDLDRNAQPALAQEAAQ